MVEGPTFPSEKYHGIRRPVGHRVEPLGLLPGEDSAGLDVGQVRVLRVMRVVSVVAPRISVVAPIEPK